MRSLFCVLIGCGPSNMPTESGGESFENPYDVQRTRLEQTTDSTVAPSLSLACSDWNGTKENSWYRVFSLKELGIDKPLTVYRVNFGVQTTYNDQRVKVAIGTYAGTYGSVELDVTKIDVLGLTTVEVDDQTNGEMLQANFPAIRIPAESNLIVEVKTEGFGDGKYFYLGATQGAETMPGYLRAPTCNAPNPTMTSALGYSQTHIIIAVSGAY